MSPAFLSRLVLQIAVQFLRPASKRSPLVRLSKRIDPVTRRRQVVPISLR